MNNREIIEKQLEIFNDLNEQEQNLILNSVMVKKYSKHQMLKTSESGCSGLMFVKQGEIRVYMLSDEGKDVTLYRLREGDVCIFSSMCVINQINFDVFIESMSDDAEILQLSAATVGQLNNNSLLFENYVLNLTIEKFNEVMWTMQQILFKSMDVRLASFLIDESLYKESDTLKLTHEEIAKYLGSAREVITRTLKYFQNEHLVRLFRGGLEITDRKQLKMIANK